MRENLYIYIYIYIYNMDGYAKLPVTFPSYFYVISTFKNPCKNLFFKNLRYPNNEIS